MDIKFQKMDRTHQKAVMDIYNDYIKTSTAAFPAVVLADSFYEQILERTKNYPAFVLVDAENVVGFCFLSQFHMFSTFQTAATITYFLSANYVRKGLGTLCIEKMESEALLLGIHQMIAEISSENEASINFHKKHGFREVGRFSRVGQKLDRTFDIVCMQKEI
ncbi:MAG: N-acetyltransferase family protein [Christensenellaceae bacterium]